MIHQSIEKLLIEQGANLVGFADLTSLPADCRQQLPYGIVFGIALNPAAVAQVPRQATMAYYNTYQAANRRLDELCVLLGAFLVRQGYAAVAQTMDLANQQRETAGPDGRAWLPHKTVATLAGLGWIGKNDLLITEQYGSALRISSVLTDAPLPVRQVAARCLCGDCRLCVDACPGQAIHNVPWTAQVDRDALFDPDACRKAIEERGRSIQVQNGSCGVCLAVCPYTAAYLEKTGVSLEL